MTIGSVASYVVGTLVNTVRQYNRLTTCPIDVIILEALHCLPYISYEDLLEAEDMLQRRCPIALWIREIVLLRGTSVQDFSTSDLCDWSFEEYVVDSGRSLPRREFCPAALKTVAVQGVLWTAISIIGYYEMKIAYYEIKKYSNLLFNFNS